MWVSDASMNVKLFGAGAARNANATVLTESPTSRQNDPTER